MKCCWKYLRLGSVKQRLKIRGIKTNLTIFAQSFPAMVRCHRIFHQRILNFQYFDRFLLYSIPENMVLSINDLNVVPAPPRSESCVYSVVISMIEENDSALNNLLLTTIN